MLWRSQRAVLLVGAWVGCALLAAAADPATQTSFVTNESLEVPGMTLAPGRYVLRLIEPGAERNVLQVFEVVQLWTGDESRLLSTLLTMANYDLPTTDKTVFAFFERDPKQPKALRLWFAPGRNYGQEFVYPMAQAVAMAKTVGHSVLSMPAELPGDIGLLASGVQRGGMERERVSPLAGQEPPVSHLTVTPPAHQLIPPRALAPVPTASSETSAPARKALPKASGSESGIQSRSRVSEKGPNKIAANLPGTASYLPLGAVLGILGITVGVLLHILAIRLERK